MKLINQNYILDTLRLSTTIGNITAKVSIYATLLTNQSFMKPIYKVGIDPGVKTGIAIVCDGKYISIETMTISKAFKKIEALLLNFDVELYVENPNLRTWFGQNSNAKKQGAGAIKVQYTQWVDYCKENKIKLNPVHPKEIGSLFDNEIIFKQATKWQKKCSIHARDAAKILYKFTK